MLCMSLYLSCNVQNSLEKCGKIRLLFDTVTRFFYPQSEDEIVRIKVGLGGGK